MLQALLRLATNRPSDVQIWHCNPLVVVDSHDSVLYSQATEIEFTPFETSDSVIGHGLAVIAGADGVQPEISVSMRQYIDNLIEFGKRQGIVLTGVDQNGTAVRWLINGAVDRFFTTPDAEPIEYDEETAKLLAEEMNEEPDKVNLNSYL